VRVESVPHIAELPDAMQQLRDGLGNAIAELSVPDFGALDHEARRHTASPRPLELRSASWMRSSPM